MSNPFNLVCKGFTLIELIVSMTIISIALLGVLLTINTVGLFSSDPMIVYQAVATANSYLEEIMTKNFPVTPCPTGAVRAVFTNICQYNGISQAPTDQTGALVGGLGAYTVSVVVDSATASVGSPALISGTQAVRVDVQISHPQMQTLTLSAYKTNY